MIAELMDAPFVSFATKWEVNGGTLLMEREVDGGVEVLEVPTPAVFSCQKGMAEWRIPNMKGIAAARRKNVIVAPAAAVDNLVQSVHYELPPAKTGCKYFEVGDTAAIIQLLADKGVI